MSVTWFDSVAITVEVAFTTDPLAVTPTWTDISAYVLEIPNITSGRSSEFSQIAPSTMSVVLMNGDRRFDPEYSSGPYYGNLGPMKKIRVKVVYSAVSYYLFTGYVQGWPQEYQSSVDSTVTVECVDGSRFLENAPLARSAYEAAVLADAPSHYWPLKDRSEVGVFTDQIGTIELSAVRFSGNAVESNVVTSGIAAAIPIGAETCVMGGPESSYAPSESYPDTQAAGFVSGAQLSVEPRSIEMWFRAESGDTVGFSAMPNVYAMRSTSTGSPYTVSWLVLEADRLETPALARPYINFSSASLGKKLSNWIPDDVYFAPGEWHHVVVTADTSTVTLYVNGAAVDSESTVATAATTSGPPNCGFKLLVSATAEQSEALSNIAVYSTTLSAARVSEHYLAGLTAYGHPFGERSGARVGRVLDEIGWPSGDRVLSTGDTVHGPYFPDRQSAMKYLRAVETAEDGYVFLDGQGRLVCRDRNWQWTQTVSVAFSDTPSGAELDYVDIEIDANTVDAIRTSVSASYGADGYLFSEDATSLAAYGPAREPLSVPTIDSAVTARGLTAYKLRTMKDPQTRITQLVHTPRILNAISWPKILGLEIGDRITVERHPQGVGSAIVKTLVVQGIEHRIDPVWWETRLYLSPAPASATAVPYLIVGDATYGKIGAVAGNQIPF